MKTKFLFASSVLALLGAMPSHAAISVGSVLPTADEQTSMDLINRFRADPQGELARELGVSATALNAAITPSTGATAGNGTAWSSGFWTGLTGGNSVATALDYFHVNPGDLLYQWQNLPGAGTLQPYVWNGNLGQSSLEYAKLVVADAGMTSNPHAVPPYNVGGLGTRFNDAGYTGWSTVGENIARDFPNSISYMQAGFAIDWGGTSNGIQNPSGHRNSMLSSTFTEIGIGITPGIGAGNVTQVQHFGERFSTEYVWGYTFMDSLPGGYTFGEGLQGVTVQLLDSNSQVLRSASTDVNGGYMMDVAGVTNGGYQVRFVNGSTVLGTTNVNITDSGLYNASFGVTAAVPEPTTEMMFLLGGLPLLLRLRRRAG